MNIRRFRTLTLCLMVAFSTTTLLAQFKDGSQSVTLALSGAPEQQRQAMEGLVKKLQSNQDIN